MALLGFNVGIRKIVARTVIVVIVLLIVVFLYGYKLGSDSKTVVTETSATPGNNSTSRKAELEEKYNRMMKEAIRQAEKEAENSNAATSSESPLPQANSNEKTPSEMLEELNEYLSKPVNSSK